MHNIELLEKQWKRYQIKKYFPLIAVALFLLIGSIVFNMFDSKISNDSLISKQSNMIAAHKAYDKENLPFFTHGAIEIMEPAFSGHQALVAAVINQESNTTEEINDTNNTDRPAIAESKSNLSINNMQTDKEEYRKQKIKINLEQTTDINSITDVMRRFYESKDPNDSLFLAINYYEQNDYSKAFYWAIETNKITEDLEESWLIMAKSKAKMGDRNEAIRILRAYAAKTNSKKALDLLNQIETNQW
ncbi:MAG: CDC27 family protein [Sulfurovaceae bacterium]